MRSTVFITLSLIVHVICIAALALKHFKNAATMIGSAVEVTLGDASKVGQAEGGGSPEVAQAAEPTPPVQPEVAQPEIKPAPVIAAPVPMAQTTPKIKKAVKPVASVPKTPSELPAKPTNSNPEPVPQNMDPAIDDADAVAVAPPAPIKNEPTPQQEEPPKFVPVKEKVAAGVEASPVSDEQKDVKEASSGKSGTAGTGAEGPNASAAPLGQGGDTKDEAVSYLKLRQLGGNRAPDYPITARKEQRQGTVGLVYRVTTEGRVADVQVEKSSGHPDLDEAAASAISKFKFAPGQEGWCKHPVIFTLKGVAAALPSKLRTGTHAAAD